MIGDIAQLGERLPCTQEVSGSIPLISTKSYHLIKSLLSILTLRNRVIERIFTNDNENYRICSLTIEKQAEN